MKEHWIPRREAASLPAGRILDSLIEEYVFGRIPLSGVATEPRVRWFHPKPRLVAEEEVEPVIEGVPAYSRELEAAVKVQEALEKDGLRVEISVTPERMTSVRVFNHLGQACADVAGDDYPLAVCRAALCVRSIGRS